MNPLQDIKIVNVLPPIGVNNDAFVINPIDTAGYNYCTIVANLGTSDAGLSVLKIQQSEDNGSSDSYADVTGLIVGTSANIGGTTSVLPDETAANDCLVFDIDCARVERYLRPAASAKDAGENNIGCNLSMVGILSRATVAPVTVAGRGAAEVLRL